MVVTSGMVLCKTTRTHLDSRGLTPKKKSLYYRFDHSIRVRSVTRKPTYSQHEFGVHLIHSQRNFGGKFLGGFAQTRPEIYFRVCPPTDGLWYHETIWYYNLCYHDPMVP